MVQGKRLASTHAHNAYAPGVSRVFTRMSLYSSAASCITRNNPGGSVRMGETPRFPREVRTVRFPVRARNRPHRHLRILAQYRMQFRQIDPTMARNHPRVRFRRARENPISVFLGMAQVIRGTVKGVAAQLVGVRQYVGS